MTAGELREREEFVIEVAVLMRDRLLMAEVWERLGYDVGVWVRWMTETPFMQAYRQLLFAKIVPAMKKMDLLSDRQRVRFQELGILHFENWDDPFADLEREEAHARTRPAAPSGLGDLVIVA
jgi:hypothetical protein